MIGKIKEYGYGPVLLLFAMLGLSNGLGGSQTMACRMLPHILSTVADVPAVRHTAEHRHAEMKPDMIVQHLVFCEEYVHNGQYPVSTFFWNT